jgi:cytochrome c553
MVRDHGPFNLANPWPMIGWSSALLMVAVSVVLGFVVLPRYQLNGPVLDPWSAICTALGLYSDTAPAAARQPTLRTPTNIAWVDVQRAIATGDKNRGSFVALNCTACHGDNGVSHSGFIPTLAGMDATVLYKQLDDYHSRKRLWGVMNGIASALTAQDRADVASYLSSLAGGLPRIVDETPEAGRSLRQRDPAIRLVFAGDPQRGIAPCAACHGPGAQKLGAPPLKNQNAEYIKRQLAAFAQGMRANDINEQMRTIATKLTSEEAHALSVYYGTAATAQIR